MANFCTKCGTELDAGARFCTRCGVDVAEPSLAAAGVPSTAATPPAAGTPRPASTPAPVAPKSGSAVKIVLIVLGVFIGLGILAGAAVMFGIWGLSRAVHVDPSGEKVRIATPMGAMTMGKTEVTEAELGIPIYPGAVGEQGGFQFGTSEGSVGTFVFQSADSPDQVLEYYRGHLGETVDVVTTPQGGIITSARSDREGYMITVGRDEDNGTTVINIVRGIGAH